MIQINITGADAAVTQTETLTAGRVGLECSFSFDSAWDGLSKIAVCEGADTRSVVMDSDTIIVPWECLADPGYKLRVGVRGENSSGDIVIPTVWARVGKIADSPGDDIDPGQEATPSVVQQIQETAANALYIARGVKAEADSGAFDGQDGISPTVDVSSITGGHQVSVTDATGTTTFDVLDGEDGAPGQKGDTGYPTNVQVQNAVDNYLNAHSVDGTFSNNAKNALLALLEQVAYVGQDGQTYLVGLRSALFPVTLSSIDAVFTQGAATIYTTDSLDTLKQYLTVTAHFSDNTSIVVTGYTLSGTLEEGTSTITASYSGKTATFDVTVTEVVDTYSITNSLTGCTSSNSATAIESGLAYSATLSAACGYTLANAAVSITMGGVDITSTAYSNGSITIASVTGNIVITVVALEVTLSSISAVYTQSGTVYDSDSLDSLKTDLVVTANYSDSTTETVPAVNYTLSGTLTEGTSTITVSYSGKTATFAVTVTSAPIPVEYKQIQYVLRPSGTTVAVGFNTTGVALNGADTAEIRIGFMATASQPSSYGYPIACRQSSSDGSVGFGINVNQNTTEINAWDGTLCGIEPKSGSSIRNTRYDVTVIKTPSGLSITDGTNSNSISTTPRTMYGNLTLFGCPSKYSGQIGYHFYGRIYYATVLEGGVKKADLVPCRRLSDNAIGWYDTVQKVFRSSAYYTAGPDVE